MCCFDGGEVHDYFDTCAQKCTYAGCKYTHSFYFIELKTTVNDK